MRSDVSEPDWTASGSLVGVALGTIVYEATYNAVFVEVPWTVTTGTVASVTAQIRPSASKSPIRPTLPFKTPPGELWAVSAALDLEAGSAHQVRVTVTDNGGNSQVVVGTVTTRTDATADASTLTPTRFVRTTGDDTNDGLSPETAWRTYTKAWDTTPSGGVAQFGPGIFVDTSPYTSTSSQTGRITPLTMIAQYPACDDDGALLNDGQRSVIVPAAAFRTAPNTAAWTQVTLTGPGNAGAPAGAEYQVWLYQSTGDSGTRHLWWHTTELSDLQRVAHWKIDASHLATAAGWAEKLYTNLTYDAAGFWVNSSGDVYLRLPGDVDPNTVYISMVGAGNPAMVQGAADGSRFSGLHFRGWHIAVATRNGLDNLIVDHCWVEGMQAGVYFHQDTGQVYGVDPTVEHCRFTDTSLRAEWGEAATNNAIIPWQFMKSATINADGTTYATKIGNNSENRAISGRGSSKRLVFRHNYVDGVFNGIYSGDQTSHTRDAGKFWHCHDNVFRNASDDAFEPEVQNVGWLLHDNVVEQCLVYLSTGPNDYGPIWCIRERVWRIGANGVGLTKPAGAQTAPGAYGFKYSGSGTPECTIAVYHSTFWTDATEASGAEEVASPGSAEDIFDIRGSYLRFGRYAFLFADAAAFTEDGNIFGTSDVTRGLRAGATNYTSVANLATYRTATGQGATTNVIDGVDVAPIDVATIDALMPGRATGDLTLVDAPITAQIDGVSDLVPSPRVGAEP